MRHLSFFPLVLLVSVGFVLLLRNVTVDPSSKQIGSKLSLASSHSACSPALIPSSSSPRNLFSQTSSSRFSPNAATLSPANIVSKAQNEQDMRFPELKNDLLLRAARGEPTERVPVWIHRQAGRYLPEFREIAEKNGYMKCFNTPSIAADLTVQPIEKYQMDAAILFSDILVLLPVMGVEWTMTAGVEPYAVNAIKTDDDVEKTLVDADTVDIQEKLGYVFESVTLTRQKLEGKAPLIGFSGAPWTLLTYTMHGKDSNGRTNALEFIKKYPEAADRILQNAEKLVVKYLIGKVEAGSQMLQVFDSWAGILSEEDFRRFSLPYLLQIAKDVKSGLKAKGIPLVPMTVFPRGCGHSLKDFEDSEYDVVSLDEDVDPSYARSQLPSKTLQGNFQGKFIYDEPDVIRREASDMVKKFGTQRYIANFGYAVEKEHSPERIGVFVDEVRAASSKMNEEEKQSVLG